MLFTQIRPKSLLTKICNEWSVSATHKQDIAINSNYSHHITSIISHRVTLLTLPYLTVWLPPIYLLVVMLTLHFCLLSSLMQLQFKSLQNNVKINWCERIHFCTNPLNYGPFNFSQSSSEGGITTSSK